MSRYGETHIPRLVAKSRRAQNLPEHVEDPAALARVVVLLRAVDQQAPKGGRDSAPAWAVTARTCMRSTRPPKKPPTPSDG
jgi:hypothetical protein